MQPWWTDLKWLRCVKQVNSGTMPMPDSSRCWTMAFWWHYCKTLLLWCCCHWLYIGQGHSSMCCLFLAALVHERMVPVWVALRWCDTIGSSVCLKVWWQLRQCYFGIHTVTTCSRYAICSAQQLIVATKDNFDLLSPVVKVYLSITDFDTVTILARNCSSGIVFYPCVALVI